MYSERAYDLAFPDDPIREYFEPIYKSIDDKYKPIIEEYDRLLKQYQIDGSPKVVADNDKSNFFDIVKKFIRCIINWFNDKFSITYPELSDTAFPDKIDTNDRICDLYKQYHKYIEDNDYDTANKFLITHPELSSAIVSSDRINKFADIIGSLQQIEKEDKLKEYCLSHLSMCVDQSLPFEIATYDWKQCPELSKNQVSVYLYIPDYNLIKKIEAQIKSEKQSPSPNEDVVYAYGGRGNQVVSLFSNTLSNLYGSLEKAKNNLSIVYREVICINPMLLVETIKLPTKMQR